jgi:hypothetical protein
MPKSLIFLLLLTGCASGPTMKFANTGAPNATVTYRHKNEIVLVRSVVMNIFEADEKCQWKPLGGIEVSATNPKLSLPTERLLQLDVHFGTMSVLGPHTSHSTLFYRFDVKSGENYILEILDDGSSKGFQVYRGDGKSRVEVPYVSLAKC